MKRGDTIVVRAQGGKLLERIVLEVHSSYVLACRVEAYEEAKRQTGLPEAAMGFPIEDVTEVRAGEAA